VDATRTRVDKFADFNLLVGAAMVGRLDARADAGTDHGYNGALVEAMQGPGTREEPRPTPLFGATPPARA
jgi:hypothetical protein